MDVFHGMLRPGEAAGLKIKDFLAIRDGRRWRSSMAIVIREPKTQRRYARTQHVVIDEEPLVRFTCYLLKGRRREEFLYGLPSATFASRLALLLTRVGLGNSRLPGLGQAELHMSG